MVRRMDSAGYARHKMGPKLMNCGKPEQVGTKEHEKTLPAKKARNWKIEGQKRRITREEHRRLWNEFETGGFITKKGLWNVARKKMLQDRGALSKEEEDIVREYKAMHEENVQNSWPREDVGKA